MAEPAPKKRDKLTEACRRRGLIGEAKQWGNAWNARNQRLSSKANGTAYLDYPTHRDSLRPYFDNHDDE